MTADPGTSASSPGVLLVVGTPIGNLGDITPRATAALESADVVACEDSRRTGRLLAHLGVAAPKLLVANEHTEVRVAGEVVGRIAAGERVALVTDAGMPGISDPGAAIVREVIDADLGVEVVPGPTALAAALVVSGLPTRRFVFEGFIPRRGAARRERLAAIAAEERTSVLYEAPHRLGRTLEDLRAVCGVDRRVALLRELTKLHEEHWRGTLDQAVSSLGERQARGEYVLVLAGAGPAPEPGDDDLLAALDAERRAGKSNRDAVDAVVARFSVPRRRVYRLATSTP